MAAILGERHALLFKKLREALEPHDTQVRLLDDVRDIWVRDFAPVQIAPNHSVTFRYEPDYLRDNPELRTGHEVASQFVGLGQVVHSEIVLDGGNVVASANRVIVTEKIYTENPDWNRQKLRDTLCETFRVDELIVIPKEPYDVIGHSDGMVRFVNEDTVVMNDYTVIEPVFHDRLVKILCRHKLKIETLPYCPEDTIVDGIPSAVGCYVNFLRVKNVLVVATYGRIEDEIAWERLASLFPGLPVVSLDCVALANCGGVLNCVTATYRKDDQT